MRPKTFSLTSPASKPTTCAPRLHSRQPPPKRTFPCPPFPVSRTCPTFNEGQTRREPPTTDRNASPPAWTRHPHHPTRKPLGLRRFRALGTSPARRPHSHHPRPGFLGQPALHPWYPSRCGARSTALSQPVAVSGTVGRGISGRGRQRVGGMFRRRD